MKKNKTKQKNPLLRIISMYISKHKVAFILSTICVFISSVASIAAPLTLQNITNLLMDAATYGNLSASWAQILTHFTILIGFYCLSVCAVVTYTQLNAYYGQKFLDEMRRMLFEHMEDLPVKYFDTHAKGDIMSIYLNDIDTIREIISSSLPQFIMFISTFLSVVGVMLFSSIYLFLIVVVGISFMFFAVKRIGTKSSRFFIKTQVLVGKEEGYVEEMMHGLKVIKSFCHEEEAIAGFDDINKQFRDASTAANANANITGPVLGNIGNFIYVVVAIVGTILFINNVPNLTLISFGVPISVGIVVSFLPMSKQLAGSAVQMAQQVNSLALAIGGCKRVFALLDEPVEVDEGYVGLVRGHLDENENFVEEGETGTVWAWKHPHQESGEVTYTLLKGDIRMFDVDFGYEENKIVLHDVSLYAKPGQKLAFVGATGAGKTTITNLLNRFYDIADGKIRYDDININKIKKKDLRRSLGMVLQDTNLFTGTIMDNIRYGNLEATDEECIAAAKLANADSFISRLPQGYQTVLTNDGANLSQGQRQLLSIARAAVHGSPVLILDEATSSIDTRTESIVTKGMDNLMKGKTVLVIAHRLSTIQNSDAIIVLDHGKIIERGTHDYLIEQKGVYYQLYTGAFELE